MTNPLFDLTGRSALATGPGGGIVAAAARVLAAADAAVLVSDIDGDVASTVAQKNCASPERWCFLPPMPRRTSPGRCCRWTAAW